MTVIDNGPDDTPLALDARVRIVRSGGNLGYAGGANLGIADWLAGDADFCIVACHDVQLEPDALERLVAFAVELRDYGVLAPGPGRTWPAGRSWPRQRVSPMWPRASGTCLLLRRTCIEVIGPFDEEFGSYGEDIDLCYRARGKPAGRSDMPAASRREAGSVNRGFRTQMYVNQVRLRRSTTGSRKAARMLAAFPVSRLRTATRSVTRRDPVLLQRAGGRVRAVPGARGCSGSRSARS